MRLALYSSKSTGIEPNLVAIQDPQLKIPTVLVCPVLRRIQLTALRTKILWHDEEYVVACDLARPINRRVLRPCGLLDGETSRRVMEVFQTLLAGDF